MNIYTRAYKSKTPTQEKHPIQHRKIDQRSQGVLYETQRTFSQRPFHAPGQPQPVPHAAPGKQEINQGVH